MFAAAKGWAPRQAGNCTLGDKVERKIENTSAENHTKLTDVEKTGGCTLADRVEMRALEKAAMEKSKDASQNTAQAPNNKEIFKIGIPKIETNNDSVYGMPRQFRGSRF